VKANSKFLNFPFYGEVRLNRNGDISYLNVLDRIKRYGKTAVRLRAPISLTSPFPDTLVTGYRIVLTPEEVKSTILDQLPIRPDSIRVNVHSEITDTPQGNVNIKRNDKTVATTSFMRTVNVERSVEIKIEPFGWEPVNEIAPMIDWDKSYSYTQKIFISREAELPFGIIEKRDGKSSTALFNVRTKKNVNATSTGYPSIKAVPNPVINDLRFEIDNVSAGSYIIRIKNILGELKIEKKVTIDSSDVIPVDIDALRKGSYFYILEDSNGNVISTKRLIVLRP